MPGITADSGKFFARWTAKGSNLCLGHWEITYEGVPMVLPAAIRQNDMGTYAIYSFFDPDDDMFAEGLREDDWIIENAGWLADLFESHDIPVSEDNMRAFFRAVTAQDWRCGSCGGCI